MRRCRATVTGALWVTTVTAPSTIWMAITTTAVSAGYSTVR